ncbi:MAG: tetratricopeptide repeat protein [Fuerstiella sp.]|nr:tetratricopeptide repeat protein [Fuerstiella sp.]MCP4856175.1 tetratricopeptide repeat protein [Fuerstiella sp.]
MTDEKTVSVIVGQVRRLLYKKRTTNALEVLTAHLEEDPEDREAQELLGVCHFKSKQYEEAKLAFQELTRMAPAYAAGWVNLGAIQNLLGDHQGATRTLRKALQKDKKNGAAHYNLGIAQKALKMNSMAISSYREAIKLAPDMPEPYTNLGNMYIDMKSLSQAVKCLQEGLNNCPKSAKLAAVLDRAKELKEGRRLNEAPLGRLVDEKELAQRQIRTDKRQLNATQRNEERDALRGLARSARHSTKPFVPLLDEPLHHQLHLLQLAAAQNDTRNEAPAAFDNMLQTVGELDRLRQEIAEATAEMKVQLKKADSGS